ncbi:hypothetical protein F5B20DRAFT_589386 [Whalleya microplaca]|nr:hypothetical protein F5B20DRAFT_589386 [Whalleya microplaca]
MPSRRQYSTILLAGLGVAFHLCRQRSWNTGEPLINAPRSKSSPLFKEEEVIDTSKQEDYDAFKEDNIDRKAQRQDTNMSVVSLGLLEHLAKMPEAGFTGSRCPICQDVGLSSKVTDAIDSLGGAGNSRVLKMGVAMLEDFWNKRERVAGYHFEATILATESDRDSGGKRGLVYQR